MNQYLSNIWTTRYFWFNLALSDLRARWRRSFFGAFWGILQPLGLTLILSFVLSRLFHVDMTHYAPYILSGVIVWEYATSNVINGSMAFVYAAPYINQCKHPLAIYTLRLALSSMIIMALGAVPLYVWVAIVMPQNIGLCWIASLTLFPIAGLMAWPLATALAYIGTRFRDVPHAMGLVMQALWFVSPVYLEVSMFRAGGLDFLVDYNPVYHVLQIVRAPLLQGEWPTLANYAFALGAAGLFALIAWAIGRKAEREVIFYL